MATYENLPTYTDGTCVHVDVVKAQQGLESLLRITDLPLIPSVTSLAQTLIKLLHDSRYKGSLRIVWVFLQEKKHMTLKKSAFKSGSLAFVIHFRITWTVPR